MIDTLKIAGVQVEAEWRRRSFFYSAFTLPWTVIITMNIVQLIKRFDCEEVYHDKVYLSGF